MQTARAMRNVNRMLRARGYHVPSEYDDAFEFQVRRTDEDEDFMHVEYIVKIGVSELIRICTALAGTRGRALLLSEEAWSSAAEKAAAEMPFEVENFVVKFTLYDIMQHRLMPKHELIDHVPREISERGDVCCIFTTDPVARYFAAKPGQAFRITRPSMTAGFTIAYRRVVVPPAKS